VNEGVATEEKEYKVQSKELEVLKGEMVWFCLPKPKRIPIERKKRISIDGWGERKNESSKLNFRQ
jgi:hypothetical protein